MSPFCGSVWWLFFIRRLRCFYLKLGVQFSCGQRRANPLQELVGWGDSGLAPRTLADWRRSYLDLVLLLWTPHIVFFMFTGSK